MSFPATFASRCPACGQMIHEGEQIQRGPDGYEHVDCPEIVDLLGPQRGEVACIVCFMIHPEGVCEG